MLRNPIHLRLEKLPGWKHLTFMACLCELMYPNYQRFCLHTEFADPAVYRRILDLLWETLLVKNAKINFNNQLEKFEEVIPSSCDYEIYAVHPAIYACVALSEAIHSQLTNETLKHAIAVSEVSIRTVAMLEMINADKEMTDEELEILPAIEEEWDFQWQIFRRLVDCEKRDLDLIKGLRSEVREVVMSNFGINLTQ